ncbi:MAG TPA: hypothetical protein VK674_04225 [Candidatus Limnocylindria bacterium]|nr:hypothetical protein [Candidatus Limnocylindria bacterium]
MPEREPTINVTGMDGLHTVVYDAPAVPAELWRPLQTAHLESIMSDLPRSEWDRAEVIVNRKNLSAYQESRAKPQQLVGAGWNKDQLHRQPQVAVTFAANGDAISGVLTSNNTSATHLKGPLAPIECWTKMLVPPKRELPAPIGRAISHRRYVHFREGYVMPNVQDRVDTEDGVPQVSGIILAGLYRTLEQRHPAQYVSSHILPDDPADAVMVRTTEAIGAKPEEEDEGGPHDLPGYRPDSRLLRVQTGAALALARIERLVGPETITQVPSRRYTTKEAAKDVMAEFRQEQADLKQEFRKYKR